MDGDLTQKISECQTMKAHKLLYVFAAAALVFVKSAAQEIDFSKYGATAMVNPGRTFYVSTSGNDSNDGKTLKNAWRTFKRGVKELRAGDTLLAAGGVYEEGGISLNYGSIPNYKAQWGKPGSPIRVMGIPGTQVVIQGGIFLERKGTSRVASWRNVKAPVYEHVWEIPSQILLQKVDFPEIVREIPGTYFYDSKKKELTVHFVAASPQGVRTADERVGIRLRGSYVHLENVIFKNFPTAVSVRVNAPVKQNTLHNVTVKHCGFFHSALAGLHVEGGKFGLFTGNYGRDNGARGTILTSPAAHDNLYIGNWCGGCPETLRHLPPYRYNYGFNFYGYNPGKRNHVIGNIFDDLLAFRWKSACPESIFRDNMVLGKFRVESGSVPVLVENNLITGNLEWTGVSLKADDASFKGTPMKFRNNVRKKAEFKNRNPLLKEAARLAVPGKKVVVPKVQFLGIKADFVYSDSAAVLCETPENDGTVTVLYRAKGTRNWTSAKGVFQGVTHAVGLNGLKPGTEYEYKVSFYGRRGEKTVSKPGSFKTALKMRAPKVLEVGKGKLSLREASCAAIPGDTVKLLPGRHVGSFAPLRSGTPGKPITLQGNGAAIDGLNFYSPLVKLDERKHIVIDNVRFVNAEYNSRKGVISAVKSQFIKVKNCISIHKLYAGPFFKGLGSDFDLENNVSCGGDYALSFHGAKNVRLHRNSIINSALFSVIFWGGTGNYSMTNNIYYRSSVPQKTNPAMLFIGVKGKIHSDGNVFFSPHKHQYMGGEFSTPDRKRLSISKTLKEWQQQTGMDKNSIHADPRFVDISKGDFRLKPGSPAAGRGALVK